MFSPTVGVRLVLTALGLLLVVGAIVIGAMPRAGASRSAAQRLLAPLESCPGSDSNDGTVETKRAAMVCLIDYGRSQLDLPTLHESGILDRVGELKIAADIRCNDFTHTPCGQPLTAVYAAASYPLAGTYAVGENLAYAKDRAATPRKIMRAWLDSPEHRANLLSKRWTAFGLALRTGTHFLDRDDVSIWANEFANP